MKIYKPLVVAGAALAVGLAGTYGYGVAHATSTTSDNRSSLITKLAETFNLKKEDVQAVFDADRAERQAEHQQKLEERLSQAVQDGTITETQKAKILAKLAELKAKMEANREAFKDKSPEERKATLQQQREELRQWAADNDIPMEFLHFGVRGHGPGFHHWGAEQN